MKSIRNLLTIVLLLSISMPGYAQGHKQMPERVKAMKAAFFTEQLELTSEEAEQFWPVYNDYESRKEKLHRDHRASIHYYMENKESISDEEAKEMLSRIISFKREETKLLEEYQDKFLEILPPKKVMGVFIAEFSFKSYLLKQLREHRGKGHDGFKP